MSQAVHILGISAYYHDSAAALVRDGEILAAAQEERFTRVKGDASFPHAAIGFCLQRAGIHERDLDQVVFYESPLLKFERLLTMYHWTVPGGLRSYLKAMPSWLTGKLWMGRSIAREMGIKKRVVSCGHHLSHAASAFFPSPFTRAAILTVDGVGEWATAAYGVGTDNQVELLEEIRFPNSLGLLYSAFTYYTGFKINSGEYKLMGLAPYGSPVYADLIRKRLIRELPDGSFVLNQKYFNYTRGLTMTNEAFHRLFGGPPRVPESRIGQKEMDIAASIQAVVNDLVLALAEKVHRETGLSDLVLAGGVALNVVAVGLLAARGPFERVWTQPAAGDAGGALGAALWMWHQGLGNQRTPGRPDGMNGALLGTDIPPHSSEDDAVLRRLGASWETMDDDELAACMVDRIEAGDVVAVARGKMEFGPRALGARSILGDARLPHMQRHMNLKIKFRESFRPFAPMVRVEEASEYFEGCRESPYMLLVFPVSMDRRKPLEDSPGLQGLELLHQVRSEIPAVTHVDYSARVQTVDSQRNAFMHRVLTRFKERTGCAVVVNTSFNVRGEPIVNSVEDAYRCFMATDIDCLVLGNRFLRKDRQPSRPLNDKERARWLKRFDPD